ncbi:MAG: VWA domain-containing protein [Clostridiales bacterium]|nr:VWA domain-containing protein [Clostridiales bacterium]
MKKTLVILMIAVMFLTLNGCGANDSNSQNEVVDIETSESTSSDDGITVESGSSSEDVSLKDYGSTEVESTDEASSVSESKSSSEVMSDFIEDRNNTQYNPGSLTAGEWNDNKNFEYFMEILNDNSWYNMKSHWNFENWTRYEFKVMNEDNQPLIGAQIELHDAQNTYYTGYTDNNGYAVIYPFLDKTFIQKPQLDARISYNQNTYEIVTLDDNYFKITLDEKANKVDNVDIMLMVDTTGSMADELEYIKTELSDVISQVNKENANNLNIRVSANYYRDHGDEYLVRSFPFTNDIKQVINEMNEQYANGGGDYEEAVVVALNDAIYNHNWNEAAEAKLLFLVLDAPPHHTDQNISQIHELIKEANALGIRIIPIASSGVDKDTEFLLRFLDISTNGTYIFLTDHSGIGNSHLTPTIGYYQVEQLNDLMVKVINSYVK